MTQLRLGRQTSAVFSPDRVFRYELRRTWDPMGWVCNFLMLNPSTADEHKNDPTVERCERFAMAWGCGALVVTNLFAYRATDPADLASIAEIVGPGNDEHIARVALEATYVLVAWGEHGALRGRAAAVLELLRSRAPEQPLYCLGRNKSGQPVHPLYQPAAAAPKVYEPEPTA